ncbi:MAG: 30S ribosome-binding factor RbfA [Porticoccaceae bacterium]
MPKEFSRSERVADAMQRELAEVIRDELRDPRVSMVNITAVEPNRDLAVAKVFINFVANDDEAAIKHSVAVLNGAAGFFRSQLARRMQLRTIPKLTFVYDSSARHGQHLSTLIDLARAEDRSRAADDHSGEDI